ncbi:hypothetical protein PG990_010756 [Apiospora arundinis]
MSEQLVVVISGVGRVIGNALARSYLSRPNCTVVGSVRHGNTPGVAALKTVAADIGSKFLIVEIESASETDAKDAVQQMRVCFDEQQGELHQRHVQSQCMESASLLHFQGGLELDYDKVEEATRDNASGKLIGATDGETIPW